MSGTIAGGRKAREANLAKDPDFYKKIGKIGGQNGHTGGFFVNRDLAREAGRKGGLTSRRNGDPDTLDERRQATAEKLIREEYAND